MWNSEERLDIEKKNNDDWADKETWNALSVGSLRFSFDIMETEQGAAQITTDNSIELLLFFANVWTKKMGHNCEQWNERPWGMRYPFMQQWKSAENNTPRRFRQVFIRHYVQTKCIRIEIFVFGFAVRVIHRRK